MYSGLLLIAGLLLFTEIFLGFLDEFYWKTHSADLEILRFIMMIGSPIMIGAIAALKFVVSRHKRMATV